MSNFAEEHPTGIGAVIAAGLVVILQSEGVTHFGDEETAIVVAAIAAVISLFTPRFRQN